VRTGVASLMTHCRADAFVVEALQRRSARVIGSLDKLNRPSSTFAFADDSLAPQPVGRLPHRRPTRAGSIRLPWRAHFIHRASSRSVAFIAKTPEFCIRDIPGETATTSKSHWPRNSSRAVFWKSRGTPSPISDGVRTRMFPLPKGRGNRRADFRTSMQGSDPLSPCGRGTQIVQRFFSGAVRGFRPISAPGCRSVLTGRRRQKKTLNRT